MQNNDFASNFVNAYQAGQGMQDNAMKRNLYQLQYQQAVQQSDPAYQKLQMKVGFAKEMAKKYIDSGDNEGFQSFVKAIKQDKELSQYIPSDLDKMTLSGPGEVTKIQNYTRDQLDALAKKTPYMADTISSAEPGSYKVKVKGGKIVDWEPHTQAGTNEYRDYVNDYMETHPGAKKSEAIKSYEGMKTKSSLNKKATGQLTAKQKADMAASLDIVDNLRAKGRDDSFIQTMFPKEYKEAIEAKRQGIKSSKSSSGGAYDPLSDPALMK